MTTTSNTNNPAGNYAPVNGINLYYELHGTGSPLIMLHGGFGTFDMFAALSPALAQNYQIIGLIFTGTDAPPSLIALLTLSTWQMTSLAC